MLYEMFRSHNRRKSHLEISYWWNFKEILVWWQNLSTYYSKIYYIHCIVHWYNHISIIIYTYGILILGGTNKIYLNKIFKLQKWALRTISNSHFRSHTRPLFLNYEILNVFETYKLILRIFMFKHDIVELPSILKPYFINHVGNHKYATRNTQDYVINKTKGTFQSRLLEIVDFLSSLENSVKQSKTVKIFENTLKSNIWSSCSV